MPFRNLVIIAVLTTVLAGCTMNNSRQGPAAPRPEITVTESADTSEETQEPKNSAQPQKPVQFINSYNVTMDINPIQKKLMATEKISYRNQTDMELDKIYIRFNINAFSEGYSPQPFFEEFEDKVYRYGKNFSDFTLTSITVDKERVGYELIGRNIGVILNNALPPESTIDIAMQFECVIPSICHRTGANADALWFGNFIPVVATFINGEFVLDQYYPAGEPFVYEASNYEVTITTPLDYSVYGTGTEKITENETNKTTKFTVNMARDFAFALSSRYISDKAVSESGVTINFHHYSDNAQRANMVLDAALMSVEYFSERVGAYPYQSIDIVETELHDSGAAAFPCMVFIDSDYFKGASNYDAVSLEVGRQWFYNVVGCDQIREAWLSTGLASYMQTRMNFRSEMVDVKMKALHAELSARLRTADNYSLSGDLSIYKNYQEYYDVEFGRASLMFHALFKKMDADVWTSFLNTYYAENSFKIASRQSLADAASQVYGESLDDFFESWISWRELPNLP